jgi:membrane protein
MSNTSTNYAELNVTNDDMKEVLAEGTSAPAAAEAAPKKQKNIGYRILALILTIAPIVCLCLLPVKLLVSTSAGYAFYGKETILDAFLALFKKDGLAEFYAEVAKTISGAAASGFDSYTLKGIPVLAGTGALGKAMSLVMYALPIAAILAIVFMVIALCSGKAAPAMARAILFVYFWAFGAYAVAITAVSLYSASLDRTFDIAMIAIAAVCFVIYLILSFIKAGKHTWMTLLLFILTVGFAGVTVYGIVNCADGIKELMGSAGDSIISGVTEGQFYKYALVALCGFLGLAAAVSSIRLSTKKGYTFDLVRYIIHLLLAGLFIYVAFTVTAFEKAYLYAFIAAAIALVQIVLVIAVICARKKAKKAAAAPAVVEETAKVEETAPVSETTEETTATAESTQTEPAPAESETGVYAEAVRYEGPTATEETTLEAEEVEAPVQEETTTVTEETATQQAPVYNYNFTTPAAEQPGAGATADYDFYNSRSFDPFIASLNSAEREQFTEIFILKYKGDTKNLPDYQVGGDNTEFFRKVFIYLGQYRDRIPDSLLSKMYQFAIRK